MRGIACPQHRRSTALVGVLVSAAAVLGPLGPTQAGRAAPAWRASVARGASPVPVRFEPASASFVSASTGFVLGTAACAQAPCTSLVGTVDGGRSWFGLKAPRTALSVPGGGVTAGGSSVGKLVFADASDGFAYGPGLWVTTDGSASWSEVRLGGPVLALAASGGFAEAVVGSCDPSSAGCSAPSLRLERAPLGSSSWRAVAGVTGFGEDLIVLDGRDGWVALGPRRPYAAATAIWRTSDAGASWERVPDPCFEPAQATDLAALASPGGSVLFELCAGNPGAGQEAKEVLASTDGGVSTRLAGRPPLGGLAAGLAAASRQVLVVSASSGASVLYRSTDAGRDWTAKMLPDGGAGLVDLAFVTPAEGVVIDGHPGGGVVPDKLLMTRDGGGTWSAVAISRGAAAPAPIGPSAVWPAALKDQARVAETCILARHPAPSAAEVKACIVGFMAAHGASAAAVAYLAATGSYLVGFVDAGTIDVGYTLSEEPMDCGCFGYLVLNGARQYQALPAPSLASPAYAALRKAYALPSGYSGLSYLYFPPFLEAADKLAGGGEELVFQFPLTDVCNACAIPYRARAGFLFTAAGALKRSISLGPCRATLPGGSAGRKVAVHEPACPPTLASPPGVAPGASSSRRGAVAHLERRARPQLSTAVYPSRCSGKLCPSPVSTT